MFPLNGRLVRKTVSLLTAHNEQYALEDGLTNTLNDFLPRNIGDFLTDLVLGNSSDLPPIPSASNSPTAGSLQAPRSAAPARTRPMAPPVRRIRRCSCNGYARTSLPILRPPEPGSPATRRVTPSFPRAIIKMWTPSLSPQRQTGCWVVQGTSATTLSCLLLDRTDLNELRSYYTELNKNVVASLPRDWKTQATPPFGGDLPNQGYESSSGAHLEVWIARTASGAVYEVHFQLVSAH